MSKLQKTIQSARAWMTQTTQMDAVDWQFEINLSESRKRRIAYIVAGGLLIIVILQAIALAGLTPLKKVEPVFVRVDNTTGHVDILTSLKHLQFSPEEALDRAFLVQYVRNREGYLYHALKDQFDQVTIMSVGSAKNQYVSLIKDDMNLNNPFAKYQDEFERRIKIKSISFLNTGVASVRFNAEVICTAGEVRESGDFIATVVYEYRKRELPETLRYRNPLDFVVTSYRVDQEHL